MTKQKKDKLIFYGVVFIGLCVLYKTVITWTYPPNDVGIFDVEFATSTIEIVGEVGNGESLAAYGGYRTTYRDGSLYLTFTGTMLPIFPGQQGFHFVQDIPNTYGEIQAIYLERVGSHPSIMIWPTNNTGIRSEFTHTNRKGTLPTSTTTTEGKGK